MSCVVSSGSSRTVGCEICMYVSMLLITSNRNGYMYASTCMYSKGCMCQINMCVSLVLDSANVVLIVVSIDVFILILCMRRNVYVYVLSMCVRMVNQFVTMYV